MSNTPTEALSDITIHSIETNAYNDQKPGTSGLRKKVRVFQQQNYLENFIQSLFNSIDNNNRKSLVVGGDGRYYNDIAIQTIIKMAIAAGYRQLTIGQHGYFSTPAVSNLIRSLSANGGIILSASHNPAGPDEDFGIKYNNASGAPAPEAFTEDIFEQSQSLTTYSIADVPDIDLSICQSFKFGDCTIDIISPVNDYVTAMKSCFDFTLLKQGFANQRISLKFDAMHAITGPYAAAIFVDELGADTDSIMNGIPLNDFGGGHPDPNLIYAKSLVDTMYSHLAPILAAASDGDGDRNMILGKNTFVTPGDSLAIITEHSALIPQYENGISGVARSMPTSTAVDRVASKLGIACYETPTGWKYFGNLLDAKKISICGEESFGTSGNHIREKDGIWAVLCWLTIVAKLNKSVAEIVTEHWQRFGRSLYCRHDFEDIDSSNATTMIAHLKTAIEAGDIVSQDNEIESSTVFSYQDPVDGSVSANQGFIIKLIDGSRIIFRLSGTGTDNATLRMYLERYSNDTVDFDVSLDVSAATSSLAEKGMKLIQLTKYTGLTKANVIT